MSGMAIVGVVFAAFDIWLTVRFINRREAWAIWVAIIFAATGIGWFINDWMQPPPYGITTSLKAVDHSDE